MREYLTKFEEENPIVYRQDRKAMKVLKETLGPEPWMQLKVVEWATSGRGRFKRYKPRAWRVHISLLDGLTPIGREQADAILERRKDAGRKAAATARARDDDAAEEVGARTGSRLGRALRRGDIDEDEARLCAFIARYRHEHTDYDNLLEGGFDREDARVMKQAEVPPGTWPEYLTRYNFSGEVAEALARTLTKPTQAHPVWFYEAMVAVERAVRRGKADLANLSYEAIRGFLEDWRYERAWGVE